jgi:hypothetical protein
MAKDNTIKFNLRNNNKFERTHDGKYQIKAMPGIDDENRSILSA